MGCPMKDNCMCPCCQERRREDKRLYEPLGGTISYATEAEKDEQRALAERARQIIAKRRSAR